MIVWNEKIRRSEDVINAVINQLYKENINTDGEVEIFNNGVEQGCVLKIFDKYNPNLDLCFWIYLEKERQTNNEITVIVGKHMNCTEMNMWDESDLEKTTFVDNVAREVHNKARDYVIDYVIKRFDKLYGMRM